jgi:hypothetical protein
METAIHNENGRIITPELSRARNILARQFYIINGNKSAGITKDDCRKGEDKGIFIKKIRDHEDG